jgi:hypothetical protein
MTSTNLIAEQDWAYEECLRQDKEKQRELEKQEFEKRELEKLNLEKREQEPEVEKTQDLAYIRQKRIASLSINKNANNKKD